MKKEVSCIRGKTDSTVLSSIVSDDQGSFICVGYNHPESRTEKQDRFCHCWKNDIVDECGHWDKRDLIDTVSVMTQAMSTDENIRVSQGFTDEEMNENVFV